MNAAKERKTTNPRAYSSPNDYHAMTATQRFTEKVNLTITPAMRADIENFSQKHGLNLSESIRRMIIRSIGELDKELTQKARALAR